jgi:regulatory protein
MPVITAIEPQKKDPERVNVFLDGDFGFGATLLTVAARRLAVGHELAEDTIEELKQNDLAERTYGAALNFLSFRPRSRREMQDYFRRRGTDSEIGEQVIARLEGNGLVDDREFARFWVENRQAFRPRGTRALRVELRQKGLEGEVVEEALAGIGDEDVIAREAAVKKLRSFANLDEREFFRRMVGHLQRRGFPYEVGARVTRRLWEEQADASEGEEAGAEP